MRFMAEAKLLQPSVINRKVNERAKHTEKAEGRKPAKKEKCNLKSALMRLTGRRTARLCHDPAGHTDQPPKATAN